MRKERPDVCSATRRSSGSAPRATRWTRRRPSRTRWSRTDGVRRTPDRSRLRPKEDDMVDVSGSILIERSVEDVFAYVTDVTKDPTWHTDVLQARKTTDGPPGVGTVWHAKFKPSMGISEGDMQVVTFEPNRKQVMRGDVGPMHPTLTYVLEPVDAGT